MKNSGIFSKMRERKSPGGEAVPPQEAAQEGGNKKLTFRQVVSMICKVLFSLRSIFLAVPVVIAALWMASYNSEHLPLLVGINLQTTGEFAKMISRQDAVYFPLMITGGCIGLMFLSRKPIYPWLISLFTLAIPVLLLVTNSLGI